MHEQEGELIAYRLRRNSGIKLAAAGSGRVWMNETKQRFAYRCLPMRIASQAGWVLLNGQPLRAKWLGTDTVAAVVIEQAGDPPYAALSHFGEGILTFTLPFLFRTSPGIALLIRGPANAPKDGIAPLEGLVETDWAVARSSMNWKFTRANVWVEFAAGEPICMVVPQQLDMLEAVRPRIIDIEQSPETHHNLRRWTESCRRFNNRLREHDPQAVELGWQRYYFRGIAPHDESAPAEGHRTRLRLRKFLENALGTARSGSP